MDLCRKKRPSRPSVWCGVFRFVSFDSHHTNFFLFVVSIHKIIDFFYYFFFNFFTTTSAAAAILKTNRTNVTHCISFFYSVFNEIKYLQLLLVDSGKNIDDYDDNDDNSVLEKPNSIQYTLPAFSSPTVRFQNPKPEFRFSILDSFVHFFRTFWECYVHANKKHIKFWLLFFTFFSTRKEE